MRITIEVIKHEDQRYPTVGDWLWPNEHNLLIRVSELGDWRKEAAVAVHELVEAILCKADGVAAAAVDAFDRAYEADRPPLDDSEPGDDPTAPYHRQHCFATAVERMLIAALGMPWAEYEQAVEALP
ncbi:MAG TPA: hypothetical protein VNH39_10525 [Steroidobacteraceae bacterium]|nr:hypothetical protein [Steroidobacteraceae bacterium]